MSLILRQIIGYEQGKRTASLASADPQLKNELDQTKKGLNSILNKWKFDNQNPRTSQEFLNKFEPWIERKTKEGKELKEFLERYEVNTLPELANYMAGLTTNEELEQIREELAQTKELWNNTEEDYLAQIQALQENRETSEDYEALETENKNLKEQLATYAKGEDWETQTGKIITDLEQEIRSITEVLNKTENEVKDLTTERDEALREQKTAEQEALTKNNQLKNKNKEVDNKAKEIQRLKKEASQKEIALNKKLEELKKKYSKQGQLLDGEQVENGHLTNKVEELEAKIKELERRSH